jgi:hypothetical protein
MGFGLVIGFMDHLQIVTTSNYNAIANLHTSHITAVHAKSSQSAFTNRFPITDFNNGDSSAFVLMSLLSGEYPATALFLQLTNTQAAGHLTSTSYSSLHRLPKQLTAAWLVSLIHNPLSWTVYKTPFPPVTLLLCVDLLPWEPVSFVVAT